MAAQRGADHRGGKAHARGGAGERAADAHVLRAVARPANELHGDGGVPAVAIEQRLALGHADAIVRASLGVAPVDGAMLQRRPQIFYVYAENHYGCPHLCHLSLFEEFWILFFVFAFLFARFLLFAQPQRRMFFIDTGAEAAAAFGRRDGMVDAVHRVAPAARAPRLGFFLPARIMFRHRF